MYKKIKLSSIYFYKIVLVMVQTRAFPDKKITD